MDHPVTVTGKVKGEIETHNIEIPGVSLFERLTPRLAIQAAFIVFGHRSGITVSDGTRAYRVYANSTRKLSIS